MSKDISYNAVNKLQKYLVLPFLDEDCCEDSEAILSTNFLKKNDEMD